MKDNEKKRKQRQEITRKKKETYTKEVREQKEETEGWGPTCESTPKNAHTNVIASNHM